MIEIGRHHSMSWAVNRVADMLLSLRYYLLGQGLES